jgi:hypothetical protein
MNQVFLLHPPGIPAPSRGRAGGIPWQKERMTHRSDEATPGGWSRPRQQSEGGNREG